MPNHRSTNGFTLIEMLIAISLLGVMVVLLFASLRTAAESWNKGEEKISQVNQKAVVYQFFKRHLQIAKPLNSQAEQKLPDGSQTPDNLELQKLEFRGLPQSLSFVSALPLASARKGAQIFQVGLDLQQPTILKVALTPYRSLQTESREEPTILLEGLRDLRISYFGENGEGGTGWQSEWQNANRLPKLVKIHIALQDGSFWPDMIFPLKINGSITDNAVLGDQNVPSIDNN